MIKFNDFQKKYYLNKKEIDASIKRVLESGWFILGKELEKFEKDFSKYLGVNYTVGVNSGTDAIFLALKALGVERGDEIITVANTATPTISAIRMTGATPVFVDVEEKTYNINPKKIEEKITKKTKVILPVHLYGYPVEMDKILKIAKRFNLKVVEDVAQATGAEFKGRKTGTFADIGCFSFYPTKNLGAFGDAGAVVTNNKKLADSVRKLRNYGEESKFNNISEGVNSRLDELQAAILNWGLTKINVWNKKRNILAQCYIKELSNLPIILPPNLKKDINPAWHLFVIRTKRRNELRDYLQANQIQTAIHYPRAIFDQPVYSFLKRKTNLLTVTNKIIPEILTLPLHSEMDKKEVLNVCRVIRNFYGIK